MRWKNGRLMLAGSTVLAALLGSATAIAGTNQIIVARPQDADSLDAHRVSTTISLQVMNQIYGNLLLLDDEGTLHGGLAETYSVSADGKTYTFKMRPNVKCHDGTLFDAKAAKWNLDRVTDTKTASPNASSYGDIDSVTAAGDILTVRLRSPYTPLPYFLAGPLAFLMCPSTIQGDDVKPVGTGPWKFVKWVRNDHIVLERNPTYVNFNPMVENPGPPYAAQLVFKSIPEGPARMAALKTGEVTFAEPSLQDAAEMAKDKNYKVYAAPRSGQQAYIGFTHKVPPLNDPRVRRAVGYAIDRKALADVAFEGLVRPTTCPIAPGLVGSDQQKCAEWGTAYDPDKAKALLKEAGYGPDRQLDVVLSVASLQGWDESHVLMQQELAAVGINAEIQSRQFASWVDYMTEQNKRTSSTPMIWTMGMSGIDPDYLVFLFQPPGYASQGIDDPRLQAMLKEQRSLVGDARLAKLLDIEKFLLEEGYEIPLFSPGWFWLEASKGNVQGFRHGYMVMPIFNDVKVAQ